MLADRLKLARKASGLSLRAVSEQIGVSHSAIKKYEDDINTPDSSILYKLAKTYGVRTEYFFRPIKVHLSGIEYRKRSNTPKRLLNSIQGELLEQVERWQELVNLYPAFPIATFTLPSDLPEKVESYAEIEQLVEKLRRTWQLGTDAIADLVDCLENLGIWVLFTSTDTEAKFDGLMAFHNEQPVIAVSANWSGDRQRFTLAHELGHLLLHDRLAEDLDEEKACHHFASAFLLPQQHLLQRFGKNELKKLEPRELYLLKQEFGLSMQACLYRLHQLSLISDLTRKQIIIQFSKKGWRKKEPGDAIPPEKSFLFNQMVYRALAQDLINESKAAELLGMGLSRFHQERKLEKLDAVTN